MHKRMALEVWQFGSGVLMRACHFSTWEAEAELFLHSVPEEGGEGMTVCAQYSIHSDRAE